MYAILAPILQIRVGADGPGVNQNDLILRRQTLDDRVTARDVGPEAGLQRLLERAQDGELR